ncbi:VanZ family protein [Streptomyces sp. NPDC046821]|uniref:VanZ family protein n=1 Tax=Streptomyces sp. NPDC046821 TaxID=3154702 RepID=UPI0033D064CC
MQRHRSGGHHTAIRFRRAGVLLLAAHLLLVCWVTLRPLDVPWVSAANLRPFAGIRADLALGAWEAAERIGKEVLLLAPLGVLLPIAGGRLDASPLGSLVRTVAAGAMISIGIELVQTGVPGQVVDIDSLFLNTLGVALAHAAVVPALRGSIRRRTEGAGLRREEPSQGRTPTISRVGVAP